MSRRRYVRAVCPAYRIWTAEPAGGGATSTRCSPALVAELNGDADYGRITTLVKRYRALSDRAAATVSDR
jgi:hypothetical protein